MLDVPAVDEVSSASHHLPDDARIERLLARMTLDEKVACLSTRCDIPSLGLSGSSHVEGLHGLALGGPGMWGKTDPVPTTTFPQAIGLAQTWDVDLVRRVAEIESVEARYAFHHLGRGGLVVRAPNADLGRDPRWGRTEECFGEDAYLAGSLAAAFVQGLQGDHPRYLRTAALLKHFLANSTEDGREDTSADIDERDVRHYYARTFERAVKVGGARCFMAAYNALNGVPCTVSDVLDMTKREWGVDGIICTDAHALNMLVTKHHYFEDVAVAAAASIKAGITQFLDDYREAVETALDRGLLNEGDIDKAVAPNLRTMLRLGLYDPPEEVPHAKVDASRGAPWTWDEHRLAAREATEKSIVLLKNADRLLPLDMRQHKSIAVVGPLADRVLMDWYGGTPPYWVSPIEGIEARFAAEMSVLKAVGNDTSEALAVARRADVVIVCVGNHPTGDAGWAQVTRPSYGKEAIDRKSLTLEEEKFVQEIFAVNPRTVLVLVSSFPYAIEWSAENVPAIVQMAHGSQEMGHALARVLAGDVNPGGKLVQTWPRSLDHVPPLMDFDLRKGRTYMYSKHEPLYPFGHGLSYTTFTYGTLRSSSGRVSPGVPVAIDLDVTNSGPRDGDEVLQLYVTRPSSRLRDERLRLCGFTRLTIESGKTATAHLTLDAEELRHFSEETGDWHLEEGEVVVQVGGSSSLIHSEMTLEVSC